MGRRNLADSGRTPNAYMWREGQEEVFPEREFGWRCWLRIARLDGSHKSQVGRSTSECWKRKTVSLLHRLSERGLSHCKYMETNIQGGEWKENMFTQSRRELTTAKPPKDMLQWEEKWISKEASVSQINLLKHTHENLISHWLLKTQ